MLQVKKTERGMTTIDKTLVTAKMMDGFWERWVVHGVEKKELATIRPNLVSKEQWIKEWEKLAIQHVEAAEHMEKTERYEDAEMNYRKAGLYYQLIQWIIPEDNVEKRNWQTISLEAFRQADRMSQVKTIYDVIKVENHRCYGRIRIPSNPKGTVIIINPIDSTKEELFTYEMDFVTKGFATVSFDGPGQGETFTNQGYRASMNRWQLFIDTVIEYTSSLCPHLSIHLFGTSSGASWAVFGSSHAKVTNVVAVSPAFDNETIRLPDYFVERMQAVLQEGTRTMLPTLTNLHYQCPVLVVHGKKDVMVSDENIYNLYYELPAGKSLKEYEDEGHCCNYKLQEIREIAAKWFKELSLNDI